MSSENKEGLKLLREPFTTNQISKLPKPSKSQTDAVKQNYKVGIRCKICGGWHHPDVVHLDYVGHAALTDRLLTVDPCWCWEPVAFGADGLPVFDREGGLWIRLTVLGMTRLGYGNADGKKGGDAIKEAIGDALRNAAMRFGAALDLWHKGDLHAVDEAQEPIEAANVETVMKIKDLLNAGYGSYEAVCKNAGVAKLEDISAEMSVRALTWLEGIKTIKESKNEAV